MTSLPDPAARSARDVRAERLWYLAGALAAVLITLTAFVATASVSPRFCSLCHAKETSALRAGAHSSASCDSCHVRSGPLGLVEARLRVISMVAATPARAVGARAPLAGGVDRRNCVKCHQAELSRTIQVGDLRMSHAAPQKAGWSCERCHGATGHSTGVVSSKYTMDSCLQCHTVSQQNIQGCEVCHASSEGGKVRPTVGKVTPWRVTHGANWQNTHGMGNLTTCKTCHSAGYCIACHGLPMPHPSDFLSSHGAEVLANGRANCDQCHAKSSCDTCHGTAMPHPAGFLKQHSTIVKSSGRENCYRCHGETTCNQCHERHTHPGIAPDKRARLQANPVSR